MRVVRTALALTSLMALGGLGCAKTPVRTAMADESTPPRAKVLAHTDLGGAVKSNTVDVTQSGGGMIELPGPKTRPVRPHLELAAAPDGGFAARVVRGDGAALPLALRISDGHAKTLPLPHAPHAVAPAAEGGVWALDDQGLARYDASGKEVVHIARDALTGPGLVATRSGGVWVVGDAQATLITADGSRGQDLPFAYLWPTLGPNDAICGLERGSNTLHCVAPDGRDEPEHATFRFQPLERLLAVTDQAALSLAGATIRRQTRQGEQEISIQAAGLAGDSQPFVATRAGDTLHLHAAPKGTPATLKLPPSAPKMGAFPVVSIQGGKVLAYAQDRAVRFAANGSVDADFRVDEPRLRRDLFPAQWALAPTGTFASGDASTLAVATSGPSGVAVIALTLP